TPMQIGRRRTFIGYHQVANQKGRWEHASLDKRTVVKLDEGLEGEAMNRRDFLEQLAGVAGASTLMGFPELLRAADGMDGTGAGKRKLPNIILFLVDDLGWGDFGCYGNTFHETPNIDKLARDGVKFTRAYAGAPICSASRASIMTGQFPGRLHLTQWIPGNYYPHKKLLEAPSLDHLPAGVATIASELKAVGYRTGSIGKWHLGGTAEQLQAEEHRTRPTDPKKPYVRDYVPTGSDAGKSFLPEDFGFDFNVAGDVHGSPAGPNHYFGPFDYHNLHGYTEQDLLTEVLTTKMDAFLTDSAKKPFFLYLAEYAVHIPLQERTALVEKYRRKNGGKDEPDPTYAAMVESVDVALGKLRDKLEKLGIADETVILLTSDNGGLGYQGHRLHRVANNGGLRAGKGFLYEGGIREPLIVYWPGVTKPGTVTDVPMLFTDFIPTALAIAGGPAPKQPCDGLDISPVLRGVSSLERDALYWHFPHYSDQGGTPTGAMLEGDWKLIEFFEDGHLELYNLKQDPGEQYDFSSTYDGLAATMHGKLVAWRQSVGALMPTPNPDYNEKLADVYVGPIGCSAAPNAWTPCVED
ncbi:MAG: sulfatase, partial [Acidobacteriaceae bacterium]